jgi:hypothetical protein
MQHITPNPKSAGRQARFRANAAREFDLHPVTWLLTTKETAYLRGVFFKRYGFVPTVSARRAFAAELKRQQEAQFTLDWSTK